MGGNGQVAEKEKQLQLALTQIRKKFGPEAIMRLGETPHRFVEALPTGILSLDLAIGIGGLPKGRMVEIFGPEGAGKTTLCLHFVGAAQKAGGVAAFVDMEHALDPTWAKTCGVNVDELYISQPDSAEQALEIAQALLRSGAFAIIVLDSVAALVPQAELEGEMGQAHVGLQARLMSQALRKVAGIVRESNAVLIFTNQMRERIGVMFGSPETTPGGRALKHYASVRIDVRRGDWIKRNGEVAGYRMRVRVVKNKVAPPFRTAECDIFFDEGINREGDVLDVATALGLIQKKGSHYSYGDLRIGQGRDTAVAFLREHEDTVAEMTAAIRNSNGKPESLPSVNGGEAEVIELT